MTKHHKSISVERWSSDECPDAVIEIAKKRTLNILHNWRLMDYDIQRLIISCYLQGCHDTAIAVGNNPNLLLQPKFDLDFQI